MRDQCLERGRKKQGKGNDSYHFSDQDFLPCFLCKHPSCSKTRTDIST